MQDTGILQKLMERGYYAAYGQAGVTASRESEVRDYTYMTFAKKVFLFPPPVLILNPQVTE